MGWKDHKLQGIGARRVTLKKSGTIAATDVDKPGKPGTNPLEIALGTAGTRIRGMIEQVNGDDVTVLEEGWVWINYSGTAPTAQAVNKLECDGSGGVNVDAINGRDLWVEKVDTTNTKCLVWLELN
ncbi:MAG: hypothetical protein ACE5I1_20755 [bacterium]